MSSLQSIYGFNLDSDLVQKFLKDYTILAKNGKNIILCCIPSHVWIFGNEKADAAAKSALSLPVTRMKLPATDMYPRITKLIFDEWQEVWMQSNRLQLNTAKTEVLWCASSRRQHQLPQVALRVGTDYVSPTTSVRNLRIYVDSDVSMQTYMSMPGMCPADSLYYASCTAFVSRCYQQYYCCWSSCWVCCAWTMAMRRSPVYLATSSTDYSLMNTTARHVCSAVCTEVRTHHPATLWPSVAAGTRVDTV